MLPPRCVQRRDKAATKGIAAAGSLAKCIAMDSEPGPSLRIQEPLQCGGSGAAAGRESRDKGYRFQQQRCLSPKPWLAAGAGQVGDLARGCAARQPRSVRWVLVQPLRARKQLLRPLLLPLGDLPTCVQGGGGGGACQGGAATRRRRGPGRVCRSLGSPSRPPPPPPRQLHPRCSAAQVEPPGPE